MSTALAERNGSEIAAIAPEPEAPFALLDTNAPGGVIPLDQKPRMNAIATISGGKRDDKGMPARTKQGEIFIHGDAPGLQEVLASNAHKSLTVVFPSDNPRDFIQQRFAEYSASALKAYGDEKQITTIEGEQRKVFLAGTTEYEQIKARCKVSTSIYFALAKWTASGANMYFPDGVGLYRLRTTSNNSVRAVLSAVMEMKRMTKGDHDNGRVAGIPFDLFLRQEEHSDGKGQKRQVWIWQARMRPPQSIEMDVTVMRTFMDHGLKQIKTLQLEAPAPETIDAAIEEGDIVEDLAENVVETVEAASTCDVNQWRKTYFAVAGGTVYATDKGRQDFISEQNGTAAGSLTAHLEHLTDDEAQRLINSLKRRIAADAYEALAELAGEREILHPKGKPWPLKVRDIWTSEQITEFSEKIALALETAPAKPKKSVPVPAPVAPQPLVEEAPKPGTLKSAVRAVHEASIIDDDPEETERLFGGEDDFDEAYDNAVAKDKEGVSEALQNLLKSAAGAGFEHNGDMAFAPLLTAINSDLKPYRIKAPIQSLADLNDLQAALVCSKIDNGKMAP